MLKPKIISIANQKGGVEKTTTALNNDSLKDWPFNSTTSKINICSGIIILKSKENHLGTLIDIGIKGAGHAFHHRK